MNFIKHSNSLVSSASGDSVEVRVESIVPVGDGPVGELVGIGPVGDGAWECTLAIKTATKAKLKIIVFILKFVFFSFFL